MILIYKYVYIHPSFTCVSIIIVGISRYRIWRSKSVELKLLDLTDNAKMFSVMD